MNNFPRMLYKGEPIYTDSAQLNGDLARKVIKTIIVINPEEEAVRRDEGYVDLFALMKPAKLQTITPGPLAAAMKGTLHVKGGQKAKVARDDAT